VEVAESKQLPVASFQLPVFSRLGFFTLQAARNWQLEADGWQLLSSL
jgi:hypothetical protein